MLGLSLISSVALTALLVALTWLTLPAPPVAPDLAAYLFRHRLAVEEVHHAR